MSAPKELSALLARAGVTPYRRVGKVRVLYDPQAPNETIRAALAAVRACASSQADVWPELPGSEVTEARQQGLAVVDVCDDPCPRDVNPTTCDVAWLVGRCARYHFRVVAAPPDNIAFEGTDDWDLANVVSLLPAWFSSVCKERRSEIITFINAAREQQTAPATEPHSDDSEDESCPVCGRPTDAEDREILATNHLLCDRSTCPHKAAHLKALRNGC